MSLLENLHCCVVKSVDDPAVFFRHDHKNIVVGIGLRVAPGAGTEQDQALQFAADGSDLAQKFLNRGVLESRAVCHEQNCTPKIWAYSAKAFGKSIKLWRRLDRGCWRSVLLIPSTQSHRPGE